jgi:ATP-dependent DNA helicase RecQ
VLATTATANARVTDDVADQLGTDVLVLRGSLDRESLRLGVVRLKTQAQRLAWLADHLAEQPGSGIVYCLTVAATQEIADYLRSRGHDVAAYSGQTDPTERLALEQDLAGGKVKALVATSALGMGFDATLGFVVNMGAPASPVAYYQQVGRAGRGTDEATVVLLPAIEDRDIWAYFGSLAFPREALVRQTIEVLAAEGRPLSTPALETYVELNRTRLETMLKVLDVDGAVRRVRGGWEATGREWAYDEERYRRVAEAASASSGDARLPRHRPLPDALPARAARRPGGRRLRALRQLRGLRAPGRCLHVGAGGGRRPAGPAGRGGRTRKMWPTALANLGVDLKGKIAAGASEGRAVARLTDLGHGQALRDLFRPDAPDGPVPVPLVQAVIEVLRDWQPHVDGIVVVESATRPILVADLADGLSRFLRKPLVGTWAIADPTVEPGRGAMNSAQRVAAVGRRSRLEGEIPSGPVLLVDDLVVTGWSLTLAARAIRAAGATEVLPLTLAVQS